jgi:hypothetical protein
MTGNLTFFERLIKVIAPTRLQALIAVFLSLGILAITQSSAILKRIGISDQALQSSNDQLKERFSFVSHSVLASNVALVAFWSAVGLVAYLICWAAYNLIIEARNEVTLETEYENRGVEHGPWLTLLIKGVGSIVLVVAIFTFRYGLALAFTLASAVIKSPTPLTALSGAMAVLILAVEIYLIFVSVELVISSWYRSEAFTDL